MGIISKMSTEQETAPHFIAIHGRINEKGVTVQVLLNHYEKKSLGEVQ